MARFNVIKLAENDYLVQDSVPVAEGGLGDIARSGSQEGAEQAAADFEWQYKDHSTDEAPAAPESAESSTETEATSKKSKAKADDGA